MFRCDCKESIRIYGTEKCYTSYWVKQEGRMGHQFLKLKRTTVETVCLLQRTSNNREEMITIDVEIKNEDADMAAMTYALTLHSLIDHRMDMITAGDAESFAESGSPVPVKIVDFIKWFSMQIGGTDRHGLHDKYYDRRGVYIIPIRGNEIGIVETPKVFFLLGDGLNSGGSDLQCIERECMEEAGYGVLKIHLLFSILAINFRIRRSNIVWMRK